MASNAFWAYGSKLQLGDGAVSEAFSDVAEVTDLTAFDMNREVIDLTSHNSANGYREKMGGLRDAGSIAIKANWLPNNATQDETTGLMAKFNADTLSNWKIILPGSIATFSFAGFVSAIKGNTPLTGQGALDCTVTISGKATQS